MAQRKLLIIGGGLAGLSAGCYARASGFQTLILEHGLSLGGVCSAWARDPYVIDGCIHWLTGGDFTHLYVDLDIVPRVPLRVIDHFSTYRDARDGLEVPITRDLGALAARLGEIAPQDRAEIARLVEAAERVGAMAPPIDQPPELLGPRDRLRSLLELRPQLGALLHFHGSIGAWARERLRSPRLRRLFTTLLPEEASALALLMQLGYLARGFLSRPVGGTAAFRDALVHTYLRLGGEARLHTTVDEILVRDGRARGVRLQDGGMLDADVVLSTSSAPETVLRLLGGRHGADELRRRMERWPMFPPIVLASYGVAAPLDGVPQLLHVDGLAPFDIGGCANERLYLRVCNDDPALAPPGHAVVQAMLQTDYAWWATRGDRYLVEKEAVAEAALAQIDRQVPGVRDALRLSDIATPLTYFGAARSWRGAFEGWLPTPEAILSHPSKTLPGLGGFYMAGQWVEPGGGVPTALLSGRQAVQLLCADEGRRFVEVSQAAAPARRQAAPAETGAGAQKRRVGVFYATREGQTRKIAEHLGARLAGQRLAVTVADLAGGGDAPPPRIEDLDAVILAASVHVQRHEEEMARFVREHRAALEQIPAAFLSVSLSEAGAEDAQAPAARRTQAGADARQMMVRFLDEMAWHPEHAMPVAGALLYTRYNPLLRLIMQQIARRAGATTDTSKDVEYTDFAALDRFADRFAAEIS